MRETVNVVIGAGWLGRAIGESLHVDPVPRRTFSPSAITERASVVVASGRSAIPASEGHRQAEELELAHLGEVLDACEKARAAKVIVLGSSDVAGLASRITGSTPPNPRTVYAQIKTKIEEACVRRRDAGLDITAVRLAPAHGPGKERTSTLVKIAGLPAVPLPNGGHHSIGFVHIDDAVAAVGWLLEHPSSAVVAVGAGETPLRDLLSSLARAQGRRFRPLPILVPSALTRRIARKARSEKIEWALRLALPRIVEMDVPITPMPLDVAVGSLVGH